MSCFSAGRLHLSNCARFCLERLAFGIWYLILANYFAFGALLSAIPPAFYLGFKLAFAVSSSAQTVCFQRFVFCLSFCAQFIPTCGRFFGCLQIVSAYNFLLWHFYALHIRNFAVTDGGFLRLRIYLLGITSLCLYNTAKYFCFQDGKLDKIHKKSLCKTQICAICG